MNNEYTTPNKNVNSSRVYTPSSESPSKYNNYTPSPESPSKYNNNYKDNRDYGSRKYVPKNNRDNNNNNYNNRDNNNKYKRKDDIDPEIANKLTASMLELYETLQPSKEENEARQDLMDRLKEIMNNNFEGQFPELNMYGSSANGLLMKRADIDICFKIVLKEDDEIPAIIGKISRLLEEKDMVIILTLPWARCPIIKFKDNKTNIKCDMCINNLLALRNTKLISDYVSIDIRVKQLGYIVKNWAKRRKINDTYTGTLSSYAFIIMLINFLQRCNPPILPCLQQIRDPNSPNNVPTIEGFNCYYYENIEPFKKRKSQKY
jgi:DNA polymerase sigma